METAGSLRFDWAFSESERNDAAQRCREAGVPGAAFTSHPRFDLTYGVFKRADDESLGRLRAEFSTATMWDFLTISLAIEPGAAEALPFLEQSLGGAGRPVAVVGCERRAGCVLLEFRENRASLELVLGLIGVELKRFGNAARRIHILCPLPVWMQASVAAGGLRAPEIDNSRILEILIAEAHA
ncbi:MAG: hypothetical protein M3Z14_07295 [Candidatus Eremiobacteraeota bacterium]|nr:hypothetical protein [Candidatus Eremiobacteraeota bacterium]